MEIIKKQFGNYNLSTDKSSLNLDMIHDYLSNHSYWALGRSYKAVTISVDNSYCYGIYNGNDRQVGFARVVTDWATFAWICDLFILESERGKGLGKWLVTTIMEHSDLKNVRRHFLATRDAHSLYNKYGGFEPILNPDRLMTRVNEDPI
jgi:GNAT superfamily N-acetyltransferase